MNRFKKGDTIRHKEYDVFFRVVYVKDGNYKLYSHQVNKELGGLNDDLDLRDYVLSSKGCVFDG